MDLLCLLTQLETHFGPNIPPSRSNPSTSLPEWIKKKTVLNALMKLESIVTLFAFSILCRPYTMAFK
ncbi:hypothetical protein GJ744_011117 [Endocarpon pusillum]|uniref:Uncharacterized protein n=1 Tax=Endocarpon pusillum TaxID=364733 RepID=A0A8H7E4Y7_9EURO|nr:hypothetical protein GJ744_011117 [Endocarpon pusillum]